MYFSPYITRVHNSRRKSLAGYVTHTEMRNAFKIVFVIPKETILGRHKS